MGVVQEEGTEDEREEGEVDESAEDWRRGCWKGHQGAVVSDGGRRIIEGARTTHGTGPNSNWSVVLQRSSGFPLDILGLS